MLIAKDELACAGTSARANLSRNNCKSLGSTDWVGEVCKAAALRLEKKVRGEDNGRDAVPFAITLSTLPPPEPLRIGN